MPAANAQERRNFSSPPAHSAAREKIAAAVNVGAVPQRSPLRYPGGKTWLVPEIRKWLASLPRRAELFVEPFAGGATASLTAVMEGFAERAALCEKDRDLSLLWRAILAEPQRLAERVLEFQPTRENIVALLADDSGDDFDRAFRVLVRNRATHGGILAGGASLMRFGENGKGAASRWYPRTIAARINAIGECAERLHFFEGDGLALIRACRHGERAAFFVDPPYTAAGKRAGRRLYRHNELNHGALFDAMAEVRGAFLMTYDDAPELEKMALARNFSLRRVAMKNTHHAAMRELLITPPQCVRLRP